MGSGGGPLPDSESAAQNHHVRTTRLEIINESMAAQNGRI
jgi:hypothetical protein